MKLVSVVVPCYNEERSVQAVYERIRKVFQDDLPEYNYELIYVDDYSQDRTRSLIEEICRKDKQVKAIFNVKNFGFHRNVFSSLQYASGEAAFLMFGDLQDPPELLPEFIKSWNAGHKVIVGQKKGSEEVILMQLFRKLYYFIIDAFAVRKQIEMFNGYGLYDRKFLEILKDIDELQPYFKEIVAEYGMELDVIRYHQDKSARGKSNFNFLRNYDFAMQGITSSTKMLMRLATFVGVGTGIICLLFSLYVFINKLLNWDNYPIGTASIITGIFFIGAIQLFFIGILGEYILSINERIAKKPRVIIGRRINFNSDEAEREEE